MFQTARGRLRDASAFGMLSVIIIGGGLGGLSAAIGLASSGHKVTLLEAQPEFSELGAGIQLPPNSTRILKDWSLLSQCATNDNSPECMTFRSYKGGRVLHKYQLNPNTEETFGTPYLSLHRKELIVILVEKARSLDVQLKNNARIVEIDLDRCSITTASRDVLTADFIIGADGDRSFVRSVILGHDELPEATGKLVYRFTVPTPLLRSFPDSDVRELLDPQQITVWLGPRSHIVGYELPASGVFNIALTCPDPIPRRRQLGPRKADLKDLKAQFEGWDERFLRVVDMATEANFWTLLQLPKENRVWQDTIRGRAVIIGDAAHAMTPYLAQGAGQAIEDGAFLGHLFPSSAVPDDVPNLLQHFCERRQCRTLSIRAAAHNMGEIYQMEDGPPQEARDRQLEGGIVCEGFPNPFADPMIQTWIYGYDVKADAQGNAFP